MADVREAVLVRLLAIAADIDGVVKTGRNVLDVTGKSRPAIIILDGSEEEDEGNAGRARPPNSPNLMHMIPDIQLLHGAAAEEIGPAINGLRAKTIKAILTDAELRQIVGSNGEIRYQGCSTDLEKGQSMEGEMHLHFIFRYRLAPAEL